MVITPLIQDNYHVFGFFQQALRGLSAVSLRVTESVRKEIRPEQPPAPLPPV